MNDFTKEELEFLKNSVREHYKNNPPIKGSTYVNVWAEMIRKIQSLIDNYCEHEWDNFYQGSINIGIYCNKCLKKLKGS